MCLLARTILCTGLAGWPTSRRHVGIRRAARLLTLTVAMTAVVILAGCKSLPPPTPLSQLNAQQMRGYYVFQQHCRSCHSDRVSQPLNGPALRGVFKKKYLPSSGAPANDDRVINTIVNGYGIMPPMGGTMSPDDLDDLMAYLHTL